MRFVSRLVLRRPLLILGISLITSLVGGYYSARLYMNLRTDIEELLPTQARAIRDLNEVQTRLEAIESIVLLAFSDNRAASKQFVIDLAKRLEKTPKSLISSVEYRIDREVNFFREREALFLELGDLHKIRDYIRDRIQYETALRNPLTVFENKEIAEPSLDFKALRDKYSSQIGSYAKMPGGFFATRDEKVRLVAIYMPGKGLDQSLKMKAEIEKAVAEINPKSYSPDLQVKYTGNIQNMIEESAALVEDLVLSTIIVILLCIAAMLLFYRSFLGTVALMMALFAGTFWTFWVAFGIVGYLNANTAFLASIVIGNGINYGIIYLARYLEERRKGFGNVRSTILAIENTATATLTASLAAGLAYGSLMLTSFRGFNQFGIIGLIGMAFCWLSAYTTFPALLHLIDSTIGKRYRWFAPIPPKPVISGAIAWVVDKAATPLWAVSVIAIIAAAATLPRLGEGILESDLSKLRDKRSLEQGSGALYHYIDDIFGHSLSPMAILPRRSEETLAIANRLKEIQRKEGAATNISRIQTLHDFVPAQQEEKIQVLKQIKRLLPPKILWRLGDEERKEVEGFLNPKVFSTFAVPDLPPLILNKFREKDGSIGRIVIMDRVMVEGGKTDDVRALGHFVRTARKTADSVAPGTPVAGQLPVSHDLIQSISDDGPRATLFAFMAVVCLVVVLFRQAKVISQILFSLIVGVLWMVGLAIEAHLKINFLNFIALPITFGIGVDYAVNIFQRYREEGPGHMTSVIRNTGGAVMLASFTTIVGYGSLLIAGNQAFVSFGWLAVVGEITCLAAALIALPAFLRWREKRAGLDERNRPGTGGSGGGSGGIEKRAPRRVESQKEVSVVATPSGGWDRLLGPLAVLMVITPWTAAAAPRKNPPKPASPPKVVASPSPAPSPSPSPSPAPIAPPSVARALEGVVQSEFSAKIPEIFAAWPPKEVPDYKDGNSPVWMVGIRSLKNTESLGVKKRVYFKAPKASVEKVLIEFSQYPRFLDGMVKVERSKDVLPGIDHLVDFEHEAPVFFLANERYRMAYAINVRDPISFYRYQLVKGGHLLSSDGLMGLSKAPSNPDHSVLVAYDFFNIDFGPVRAFAEGSLIARCYNDSYRNDLALAATVENPEVTRDAIWEKVDSQAKQWPLGEVTILPPGQF